MLDDVITLYHIAVHKQLSKVRAVRDSMQQNIKALEDTDARIRQCPQDVSNTCIYDRFMSNLCLFVCLQVCLLVNLSVCLSFSLVNLFVCVFCLFFCVFCLFFLSVLYVFCVCLFATIFFVCLFVIFSVCWFVCLPNSIWLFIDLHWLFFSWYV